MNLLQIQYFLEVVNCGNISVAAKHLYITQPTLGRQLTAIESELNMQLFFRSNKGMKPTSAGITLYEGFQKMMQTYNETVEKASAVSSGYNTTLKIGIISELCVYDILTSLIQHFELNYQNIKIELMQYSFKELLEKFYSNQLDFIISYDFHLKDKAQMISINLMNFNPSWAIPITNILSKKEKIFFSDIKKEKLLIVKEEECPEGVDLVINTCKKNGNFYPDFYFVDSMENVKLWLNTSNKCALLNMEIEYSKNVKLFPIIEDLGNKPFIKLAWHEKSSNFAISLVLDYFDRYKKFK